MFFRERGQYQSVLARESGAKNKKVQGHGLNSLCVYQVHIQVKF